MEHDMSRRVRQRDEWQAFTCSKLVSPVEITLRNIYDAAAYACGMISAHKKGAHVPVRKATPGTKQVDDMFRKIVTKTVPNWTEDECAKEMDVDALEDIDVCIRMAVWAHATVMAMTVDRACRQRIKVPNAVMFFRAVLLECAKDHDPSVFWSKDISVRFALRKWIERCIVKHLLNLVPISLFIDQPGDRDHASGEDAGVVSQEAPPTTSTPTSPPVVAVVADSESEDESTADEDEDVSPPPAWRMPPSPTAVLASSPPQTPPSKIHDDDEDRKREPTAPAVPSPSKKSSSSPSLRSIGTVEQVESALTKSATAAVLPPMTASPPPRVPSRSRVKTPVTSDEEIEKKARTVKAAAVLCEDGVCDIVDRSKEEPKHHAPKKAAKKKITKKSPPPPSSSTKEKKKKKSHAKKKDEILAEDDEDDEPETNSFIASSDDDDSDEMV